MTANTTLFSTPPIFITPAEWWALPQRQRGAIHGIFVVAGLYLVWLAFSYVAGIKVTEQLNLLQYTAIGIGSFVAMILTPILLVMSLVSAFERKWQDVCRLTSMLIVSWLFILPGADPEAVAYHFCADTYYCTKTDWWFTGQEASLYGLLLLFATIGSMSTGFIGLGIIAGSTFVMLWMTIKRSHQWHVQLVYSDPWPWEKWTYDEQQGQHVKRFRWSF